MDIKSINIKIVKDQVVDTTGEIKEKEIYVVEIEKEDKLEVITIADDDKLKEEKQEALNEFIKVFNLQDITFIK